MSTALLVLGYPLAIAVIVRWVPVVRERRLSWAVAHTVAMAAIVAGHALEDRAGAVAFNGLWLTTSVAWYALDPARRRTSADAPPDQS